MRHVPLLASRRRAAARDRIILRASANPQAQNIWFYYFWLGYSHILLGQTGEAIDLLRKSRAANPRFWAPPLFLAASLGLRGDVDEARVTLAESLKLKPELNSMARLRASFPPYATNPPYVALRERTADIGLRRPGFPEE
jgi:adenylate cyclase